MKYRKTAADLIKRGKQVALYCDGLFSDTNILYLDKFYGVRPTVVIDNDLRKKGRALLDVPIMPYTEAREAFTELYYYIQGNTYLYNIIGSLLEDGVPADHIINYAPVEKREGCLIAETSIGISGSGCNICYETGFNYNKNHNTLQLDQLDVDTFNQRFAQLRGQGAFLQADGSDCRTGCPLYKPGYYAVEPRIRLIGDYNTDYCELACVYCFLQELGMDKGPRSAAFHEWLSMLLKSNAISDALVLHLCPTEKTVDQDTDRSLEICAENIGAFEAVHLFSCCYAYRPGMETLLAQGAAKAFWSLDAGTEETFEKVKRRKGAFGRVLDNVSRYQEFDAFGGASIVPKYSIVKGINDNDRDFDGFIDICKRFQVKYCGLQWDYADNDNTSEEDFEMIRRFARRIRAAGLKTTYTSGSTVLSKALDSLAFYEE